MYSTYNEEKSVVAERFIGSQKHMTAVLKNVYFVVLDDIVDKYNKAYHKTMKMKHVDVNPD